MNATRFGINWVNYDYDIIAFSAPPPDLPLVPTDVESALNS